jgi:hypothetical protein
LDQQVVIGWGYVDKAGLKLDSIFRQDNRQAGTSVKDFMQQGFCGWQ